MRSHLAHAQECLYFESTSQGLGKWQIVGIGGFNGLFRSQRVLSSRQPRRLALVRLHWETGLGFPSHYLEAHLIDLACHWLLSLSQSGSLPWCHWLV